MDKNNNNNNDKKKFLPPIDPSKSGRTTSGRRVNSTAPIRGPSGRNGIAGRLNMTGGGGSRPTATSSRGNAPILLPPILPYPFQSPRAHIPSPAPHQLVPSYSHTNQSRINSTPQRFEPEGYGSISNSRSVEDECPISALAMTKGMMEKNAHRHHHTGPMSARPSTEWPRPPTSSYAQILSTYGVGSPRRPRQLQPPRPKEYSNQELRDLFDWMSHTPVRPHLRGDFHLIFSDAVLVAQLIHHHAPELVNPSDFHRQETIDTKLDNWDALSDKVLVKLGVPKISAEDAFDLANFNPGGIEKLLFELREKLMIYQHEKRQAFRARSAAIEAKERGLPSPDDIGELRQLVDEIGDGDGDLDELLDSGRIEKVETHVFEDTCKVYASYPKTEGRDGASGSGGGDEEVPHLVNCLVYKGQRMIPEELANKYKNQLDAEIEAGKKLQEEIERLKALAGEKHGTMKDLAQELFDLKKKHGEDPTK